eukprot:scaffold14617_cov37-Prasinocladus_malaysianus.AAC.1
MVAMKKTLSIEQCSYSFPTPVSSNRYVCETTVIGMLSLSASFGTLRPSISQQTAQKAQSDSHQDMG